MSRPQPTLIFSHAQGDRMIEVCEADAVYAVLFEGRPVKLRSINPAALYQGYKYGKSMFPEPGHAIALARRLNQAHNTDAFTVGVMQPLRILP
jgi:hypothetical protein